MRPKPVVLLILDGFGIREVAEDNAIYHANTPTFDWLARNAPVRIWKHQVKQWGCQKVKWVTLKLVT